MSVSRTHRLRLLAVASVCLSFFAVRQAAADEEPGAAARATTPAAESASATLDRATPEMRLVLTKLQELEPKPIESLEPEEARRQPTMADAATKALKDADRSAKPEPVADVDDRTIPGPDGTSMKARVYTPTGDGPFPVVVYYHGGGWVLATIDTYDASARALANAAHAVVVAPEYRKALEHKFPAAHEDAFAAYVWVIRNAADIEGDPAHVAVAGESAGGNLAAAVAMMAKERKVQAPVHQVLVYPVASTDLSSASYRENAQAKPLNRAMMAWFFEKYLGSANDPRDPRLDLVSAEHLSGLPPATIITADLDPLRSEGAAYAKRLAQANVPVDYRNYPGVTHEFFGLGAIVPDAKAAVAQAARGLTQSFRTAAR